MQRSLFISIFFFLALLNFSGIFAQTFYAIDFTENKGQWKENFRYKSTIGNGTLFIQDQGYTVVKNNPEDYQSVLEYMHSKPSEKKVPVKINANMMEGDSEFITKNELTLRSHAYKVFFKGSNEKAKFESDKFTGESANYLLGDNPANWKTDVKTFGSIHQYDLYPGINIRYYSNGNNLKYDLTINPGADPERILMQYQGIDKLSIRDGQLIIKTSVGESKELPPYVYQIISGKKIIVECKYEIAGTQVRFKIKSYNKSFPLIIDPILVFSTYTGSKSSNWGFSAAPGPDGSLYAGGIVFGTGYPISIGAFQKTFGGGVGQGNITGVDISLTRFSSDGRSRVFSTYLGGSGDEFPHSIFVDPAGNPVILGRTTSSNFPVLNNNRLGTLGSTDIFVTKLSADGKTMIGGVVVGGKGIDGANVDANVSPGPKSILYNYGDNARSEVILDKANNIYIASSSQSIDFPTKNSSQVYGGLQDGVVMKFSPDLSTLFFSTYLGGSDDDASFVLALNPLNNNIYVGGATKSINFPGNNVGTIGTSYQGNIDGFVSILSNNGALLKSTFLATLDTDIIYGVQFDEKGFPYVMGISLGSWVIKNAVYNRPGAKQFVSKLLPDLSDYVYSTVYGFAAAVPNISPVAFLVDRCENVYVSGWGGKLNFCYASAFDKKTTGTLGMDTVGNPIQFRTDNKDFYLFVMAKNASRQLYGSFFGQIGGEGDHVDGGTSRFDNKGAIYQAICANCGGTNVCKDNPITRPLIITPGVVAPTNGSLGSGSAGECNLAAFKINFEFDGVKAGALTSIDGVFNDTAGCVPLKVDFSDSIEVGKTYQWNFGDGSPIYIGTTPVSSHVYTRAGNFKAMLISIDDERCIPRDTSYVNIRVRTDKAIIAAAGTKLPPCQGLTVRFTNNSIAPANKIFSDTSFIWDFGDNSPRIKMGKKNIDHTFPSVGSYRVKLFLNDTSFCNAFDVLELKIYLSPLVKASFQTPAVGCLPFRAEFTNTSTAGQTFIWDFGDGTAKFTGANPQPHIYNRLGNYTVVLIANDPSTCNLTDTFRYVISVKSSPSAGFSYSPDPSLENTPVQFSNSSTGATKYKWLFGDDDTSVLVNPVHLYKKTQDFNACLIAYNDFGCSDTVCTTISAIVNSSVDVPNAFTPNGDGTNDKVFVRGFGIAQMNFRIYNRWGQLVFESGSQSLGWDGKFKGTLQPMDVYAFTLLVLFSDGTQVSKKGDITLIR